MPALAASQGSTLTSPGGHLSSEIAHWYSASLGALHLKKSLTLPSQDVG